MASYKGRRCQAFSPDKQDAVVFEMREQPDIQPTGVKVQKFIINFV